MHEIETKVIKVKLNNSLFLSANNIMCKTKSTYPKCTLIKCFRFRGYSASSSPLEKHDRIAFWYTGVTCRLHRMYTQILGILSPLHEINR